MKSYARVFLDTSNNARNQNPAGSFYFQNFKVMKRHWPQQSGDKIISKHGLPPNDNWQTWKVFFLFWSLLNLFMLTLESCLLYCDYHKRTAWGCRGCGHIPNAVKLAIIWAKVFKIWAKYTATFTCKWGSVYFPK